METHAWDLHEVVIDPITDKQKTAKSPQICKQPRGYAHANSINQRLPSGETLLSAFIERANVFLIKHAMSQGANPNVPNNVGVTPLAAAVRMGNDCIIRMLLDNGADVNQASRYGFSALQIALSTKQPAIVNTLLSYGANPSGIADRGDANPGSTDALTLAIEWGHLETLRLLVEKGAVVQNGETLIKALHHKNIEILRTLLNAFRNKLSSFSNSCSFLSLAAQIHDCEKVQMLLQNGAKVRFDDSTVSKIDHNVSCNLTRIKPELIPPLAACIHFDCMECFDRILTAPSTGIDINDADWLRSSPIIYALLDTMWTCYTSGVQAKPSSMHTSTSHPCELRVNLQPHGLTAFALSPRLNKFVREFLLRGADINYLFKTRAWSIDEKTHLKHNKHILHLCLRAYQPETSYYNVRVSHMFRSLGFTLDFQGLAMVYLSGYSPSREEIRIVSDKYVLLRKQTVSDESNNYISKFTEELVSTPRTLQNIAVVSIRNSLAAGPRGVIGNLLYAASELHIPNALKQQITLETFHGLLSGDLIEQMKELYSKLN